MKQVVLHLKMAAILLPLMLLFMQENVWLNCAGLFYIVWLAIFANETERGRKFCRRYYHEILRIENSL